MKILQALICYQQIYFIFFLPGIKYHPPFLLSKLNLSPKPSLPLKPHLLHIFNMCSTSVKLLYVSYDLVQCDLTETANAMNQVLIF